MSRDLDLVLYGATGYTGQVVAEYLLRHAPPTLKWAIAGRSESKLQAVQMALVAQGLPAAAELPRIVASSDDEPALKKLAARTTVVITTVGPYAKLGMALVRACATEGTHYVDLTGEVQFIRRSIDECDAITQASGACIVHSCGFDSIPSDLGTLLLHQHFVDGGHGGLARATLYVDSMRGGISGGTAASASSLFDDAAASRYVRELVVDPYALSPDRETDRGPDRNDDPRAHFDQAIGKWTAPFVMAQVNTRVVRRSNALLGYPYGKSFRYRERMVTKAGTKGMALARATSLGLLGAVALGSVAPGRALFRKLVPASGAGPTRAQREAGGFVITVRGEATDGTSGAVRIVGKSDPGYGETATMLAESALLLVSGATTRGVTTPAAALGLPLIERLRAAGMDWHPLCPEKSP